jgi:phage shock protein PspC (stress-responsive transcriptional regulator)
LPRVPPHRRGWITDATNGSQASARRRVHVGAAIFYAAFLYVFSPMSLVVIGWFADFDDAISHRVHEVSIGALFTLGFIGVLAHLRKSDRTTGAMQAVVALSVAAGVITTSTGFEPLALAYLLPPIGLIVLDPEWQRIVTPPLRRDTRLLVFAALLLTILGPGVVANFHKATLLVQGHESHWGAMAAFAVAVTLLTFVAAMRPPGWRLAAWSAVAAISVSAVVSMAFRYDASALGVSNSVGALLWAVGYGATVLIVGARNPERVPLRRSDEGLVAGVAAAVARRTGWKVGGVRAAFALPVIGGAAYGVLWIALPTEGGAGRTRSRNVLLGVALFAGVVGLLTGGSGGRLILPLALVVTLITRGLAPVVAVIRKRLRFKVAAARIGAGIGLGIGLIMVVMVWSLDDLSAPVVPHRIESESFQYCASCHAVPGAARGAPVWPDIFEHSGGELCVNCHSHLPVSPPPPTAASWRLPFMQEQP